MLNTLNLFIHKQTVQEQSKNPINISGKYNFKLILTNDVEFLAILSEFTPQEETAGIFVTLKSLYHCHDSQIFCHSNVGDRYQCLYLIFIIGYTDSTLQYNGYRDMDINICS